jgi:hypothetical protein
MTVAARNTFAKSTLGVLGIRGYFRPGTRTTADAAAAATTLEVESAALFAVGDDVTVGTGASQENVSISAISGTTLTISALANAQPAGSMVRELGWVDLGIVKNWEPQDETEELEIEGARAGLTEVYEVLAISASLGYTFDSENPNDDDILALWNGSIMKADPGATGASSPISFDSTSGEMMWVRQNAQSAKPSQLLYHPSATIRRDGQSGTPGEEQAGLSFTSTVTADENFVIPAAVDADQATARYGYLYRVPTSDLSTAESTVSA